MPIDPNALKTEVRSGPLASLLAPLVAMGADGSVAAVLNDPAHGAPILQPSLSREEFVAAISPALDVLISGTLQPAVASAWTLYLQVILALQSVAVGSSVIQAKLDLAVTQGLLTASQRAGIGVRPGSRAEVLWGANTVVSSNDVAHALRGTP